MDIVSIAISKRKGTDGVRTDRACLVQDHGIERDAHAGPWHRQFSFLAAESIEKARKKGLRVTLCDFGKARTNLPSGVRNEVGLHLETETNLARGQRS